MVLVTATHYLTARDAFRRQCDRQATSLAIAAVAFTVEPLASGQYAEIETYARMLCDGRHDVVAFRLQRADGRTVVREGLSNAEMQRIDVIRVTEPVRPSPTSDVRLGTLELAVSLESRKAALRSRVLGDAAQLVLALAILGLLLLILIRRRVAAPLRALESSAMAIGDGDLSRPVVVRADDELGRLAETMDAMRARLREQFDGRRDLTQRLEKENAARRQAEVRLLAALREAESASRLKDAFLANVSHEMRTPLSAVIGYTDLLVRGPLDGPSPRAFAQHAHAAGVHLLSVIEDILDISKMESGTFETRPAPFRVARLLADVEATTRVSAQANGLRLEIQSPEDLPEYVVSDAQRIRQILLNLLSNAVKFTEHGSVRLDLKLRERPEAGIVLLDFEVSDEGPGIPEAEQARIFQAFVRLETAQASWQPGAGLGLAISKRLATALEGDLSVRSVPGCGSSFLLRLPVRRASVEDLAVDDPASESVASPSSMISARVLLAEDTRSLQLLVSHYLESAGHSVDLVDDGATAVETAVAAESEGRPYDCVLMDMRMSGVDGFQATRMLRARGYARPIVAITAHTTDGDRRHCFDCGCDAFVGKPIDPDELSSTVARMLTRRVAERVFTRG
jgi:signal transduction histidine kinase/CheY-like chemotaxis protein